MQLTLPRLVLAVLVAGVIAAAYVQLRSHWVEVGERDFAQRVLQARLPALVYFDAAVGCRDADTVFRTLSRQRRGFLEVFYVSTVDHPALARAYGVESDVVFVLFERGQVVKRATAPTMLASVLGRNNGVYSHQAFVAEMERFANLRTD